MNDQKINNVISAVSGHMKSTHFQLMEFYKNRFQTLEDCRKLRSQVRSLENRVKDLTNATLTLGQIAVDEIEYLEELRADKADQWPQQNLTANKIKNALEKLVI